MNRVTLRDETMRERLYHDYREQRRKVGEWVMRRIRGARGAGDPVLSNVPLPFEVLAYFSDSPVNLYQIRQWLPQLELLHETHPVFILTRDTRSFRQLSRETSLPIVNARRIATLDAIAQSSDIKMAVYVNQTNRNFQVIRYPDMLHVMLSHGESEKSTYTATNQVKAYDFTFVAGDAAVERISANLLRFDADSRLVKIGRPQLDTPLRPGVPAQLAAERRSGRTTVLYAPTWEGDRPSTSYGSVQSHGPGIVSALLGTGRHRLIYRPHPRIGVTDPKAAVVDRQLRAAIEQAANDDPDAGHRVDLAREFGPQMAEADVMVCDVSAVALDFLPSGKPLVVTVPPRPEATFDRSTFLGSVYELPDHEAPNIAMLLDDWCAGDTLKTERQGWVRHYFGDVSPGASTRRFLQACEDVITMRDRLVAEKRARAQRAVADPAPAQQHQPS